jgi:hypothetical protein
VFEETVSDWATKSLPRNKRYCEFKDVANDETYLFLLALFSNAVCSEGELRQAVHFQTESEKQNIKQSSPWLLVRKRTIQTERPPLVVEVSANFFFPRIDGYRVVSATDPRRR